MGKKATSLSVGTSVICYGTDHGTILEWANGQYRVQWIDGTNNWVPEGSVHTRKGLQVEGMERQLLNRDTIRNYMAYECITGSVAYGLDGEDSDVDTRSIYVAPVDMWCGLFKIPESIHYGHPDSTFFEIKHFLMLTMKGNPNLLEALWTDQVLYKDCRIQPLLDNKKRLLCQTLYYAYNGFFASQQKKQLIAERNGQPVNWKQYSHMIRLMISGRLAFDEGEIMVNVSDYKDLILPVKRGEVPIDEVKARCLKLQQEFQTSFEENKANIPKNPDADWADKYLKWVRHQKVNIYREDGYQTTFDPNKDFVNIADVRGSLVNRGSFIQIT